MNQQHRQRSTEPKILITIESTGVEPTGTGFIKSIDSLLELALREVEAEECSFYEYSEFNRTLSLQRRVPQKSGRKNHGRIDSARIQLPESIGAWLLELRDTEHIPFLAGYEPRSASFPEVIENSLESLLIVPLIHEEKLVGLLNFGWQSQTTLNQVQTRSAVEIAASVTSVLLRTRQASLTIHLANRINHLQAELADGKITDRARGILHEGSGRFDLGGVMRQHVNRVLEGSDVLSLLSQEVAKLEVELKNRQVISQAKQFLQQAHHLSEEEAYLQLRNTSRKSRRRLLDIAGEVLRASPGHSVMAIR
jgi:hypothetical protein